MQFHPTLRALKDAPTDVKDLMATGEFIGDGAYARVIAKSPFEVLKITSCPATTMLLTRLKELTDSGDLPLHLPQVYGCLGDVAIDDDGVVFQGFYLERLFTPDEYRERLHARRSLRISGGLDRAQRAITLDSKEATALHQVAQDRLSEACDAYYSYRYDGWKESASVAGFIASDASHPLPEVHHTFTLLESFVQEHRCDLDLETEGNLLVSAYGIPVLADPVAALGLCIDKPVPVPGIPGHDGLAVLELRPVAVGTSRVQLSWVTLAQAPGSAEAQAYLDERREAFPHAISHCLVGWRSQKHVRLLTDHSRTLPVDALSTETLMNLLGPAVERHPDLADIAMPRQVRRTLSSRLMRDYTGQSLRELMASRQKPVFKTPDFLALQPA